MQRACFAALALAAAAGCTGTSLFDDGPRKPERAACTDVAPGRYVLGERFLQAGPVDAKIKAYVQASNDLAGAANQAEVEVAQACMRIGLDLGVPATAMQARQENGGRATGACYPAAQAVDGAMRQGAQVWVRVTPPFCTPNGLAVNQCAQSCALSDPQCAATCRVHGDAYATCTPALVIATPSNPNPLSFRLASTLQANLPNLVHGEVGLARRLLADGQTLSQLGMTLPAEMSQAGAVAQGCVADGGSEVQSAGWLLQIVVRAGGQVTGRVGATSG
ncbi:MAG TPA: hypothetical protein VHB21_23595 [Minicystis sp.]|nr:hypothetical protein [Minicystis sp.]